MAKRPGSDQPILYRAVLLAAGLLVLGLLFRELVTLMVGVLVTVLFAIPVAAIATRLERYRVPRPVGALLAILLILGTFAGIVAAVMPTFVDQMDQFIDDVPGIVDDLERDLEDLTGAEPGEVGDEIQDRLEDIAGDPAQLIGPIATIGLGVAGFLAATVLGIVTAYYIAVRPQPLIDGALSLFPPSRRQWALQVGERIRGSWIGWMKGVAIDMLANGLMIWAGLELIGLEFALVFGVVAGLFTVVPYFGPVAAGILTTLFALATAGFEQAVLVIAVFLVVQQIEGNLTIPLVMAQTVRLHPAVIAIGIVIMGQLLGFIGLFVAVPILSLLVILVDEIWVKPQESETMLTPDSPGAAAGGPPG